MDMKSCREKSVVQNSFILIHSALDRTPVMLLVAALEEIGQTWRIAESCLAQIWQLIQKEYHQ